MMDENLEQPLFQVLYILYFLVTIVTWLAPAEWTVVSVYWSWFGVPVSPSGMGQFQYGVLPKSMRMFSKNKRNNRWINFREDGIVFPYKKLKTAHCRRVVRSEIFSLWSLIVAPFHVCWKKLVDFLTPIL